MNACPTAGAHTPATSTPNTPANAHTRPFYAPDDYVVDIWEDRVKLVKQAVTQPAQQPDAEAVAPAVETKA